jgi:hypothetical protein
MTARVRSGGLSAQSFQGPAIRYLRSLKPKYQAPAADVRHDVFSAPTLVAQLPLQCSPGDRIRVVGRTEDDRDIIGL